MANAWITHVKKVQKKYNCSYKDALIKASKTYIKGGSLFGTAAGAGIGYALSPKKKKGSGAILGALAGTLLTR